MPIDHFLTDRLAARNWRPVIIGEETRAALEAALSGVLTDRVLEHLPPALQLESGGHGIAAWIDARAAESDVLLVERRDGGTLLGLLILAPDPEPAESPALHLGYLLAEPAWGQGLASELVNGLVAALEHSPPVRLLAGVDTGNPASARVLQKAGFTADPGLSDRSTKIYARTTG